MKIGTKGVFGIVLAFVLLASFVGSVYAITGSIGNARMILRPEVGDTIERSILVKNVNEVAIDVEVTAAGDLDDDIEIKDTEFSLEPGEEKKAFFSIDVREQGTTESKINVKFSPKDGGNGVGLSSTIIVIAEGESSGSGGLFGGLFGGDDEPEQTDEQDVVDKDIADASGEASKSNIGPLVVGGTFTIILFVVLLILLALASKHMKKGSMESEEKKGDEGVPSETKSSKKSLKE